MKSLHPVYKFLGIFIPAILLAFFYNPLVNLIGFTLCMLLILVSQVKLKPLFVILIPLIAVAVGMFVTGMYFKSDAYVGFTNKIFTDGAIYNGLQLSSRVLVFGALGMLFVFTTDNIRFVRALEQSFKLPPKVAYGLLAALGMFPNMQKEYKKTKAAFNVRGVSPFFMSPALLVLLLIKCVRYSELLACAMESKGFGEEQKRSIYHAHTVTKKDIAFPVISTSLTIIGIIAYL